MIKKYHTFLIQKIYRGSKYFHEISFLPQMLNNGYYLIFFWQQKGAVFTQNHLIFWSHFISVA